MRHYCLDVWRGVPEEAARDKLVARYRPSTARPSWHRHKRRITAGRLQGGSRKAMRAGQGAHAASTSAPSWLSEPRPRALPSKKSSGRSSQSCSLLRWRAMYRLRDSCSNACAARRPAGWMSVSTPAVRSRIGNGRRGSARSCTQRSSAKRLKADVPEHRPRVLGTIRSRTHVEAFDGHHAVQPVKRPEPMTGDAPGYR